MPENKILFLTLALLIELGVSADVSDDWTAVQRRVYIPLDLETTPLEIRTDSTLGSKDRVVVRFVTTQRKFAGGVEISFSSTPQYYLWDCTTSSTNFPSNLPSEVDKVWRITLDKTAVIRVLLHCNGVEVLNILMSDNTCDRSDWSYYWSKEVEKIYTDTVSDYYRAGETDCTGLRTEWMSTLETTTQFPVDPGTVVEVTCSETGAINTGSSEVTCTFDTYFTYQQEPNCVIPDCTGLKTEWTSTLETTTQFPVDPGTVVEVTCSENGAINTGSSEVTCTFDTYFTYQQEPNCVIPGDVYTLLYVACALAGTFFLTTILTCLFAGQNICLKKCNSPNTESEREYIDNVIMPARVNQPDSVNKPVPQNQQVPEDQQVPPNPPNSLPVPTLPPVTETAGEEEPVYCNSELTG